MRVNKEGYKIIGISAVIIALLCGLSFLIPCLWAGVAFSIIGILLWLFIVSFFREPKRPYLADASAVFSPADGKVVVVEKVFEKEYLNREMIQVSVFMSLGNVHVNWFPVGGRVEYFRYHPGKYMVAWHPKSSEHNERTTTVVDTPRGKVLFRQIAGLMARRIVSYSTVGDLVRQNDKCGFIKFGSRLDVLLPVESEILVSLGDKVTGSQTILARLPENT